MNLFIKLFHMQADSKNYEENKNNKFICETYVSFLTS